MDDYSSSNVMFPPGFGADGGSTFSTSSASTGAVTAAKTKFKWTPLSIGLLCAIIVLVLFTVIYFPIMYAPRKKSPAPAPGPAKPSDALAGTGVYLQSYKRALPAKVNTSLLGLSSAKAPDVLEGPLADNEDTITFRKPAQAAQAPASSEEEPFISADVALIFLEGAEDAVVIVVSPGCGACHRLRESLKTLRASGGLKPKKLGLLAANDWKSVSNRYNFDLNSVPTLFKVGKGKVKEHRIGNMPVEELKQFVNKD